MNLDAKDIEITSELILESDFNPELETTLEAYISSEPVFDKLTDSMLITEALRMFPEESECDSLNQAGLTAAEITDVNDITLRGKFSTSKNTNFPKDEFLQAINFETRELGMRRKLDSELRSDFLQGILTLISSDSTMSVNAAIEDMSANYAERNIEFNAGTIWSILDQNSNGYEAAINADPAIKELIDEINEFKQDQIEWTTELRKEVLEFILINLKSNQCISVQNVIEKVAEDKSTGELKLSVATIRNILTQNSNSYEAAIKADYSVKELIDEINKFKFESIWTTELRKEVLESILISLKSKQGISVKGAIKKLAKEISTDELNINVGTVVSTLTKDSYSYEAAIKADSSVKELIDEINKFKKESNKWTSELRKGAMEKVRAKLPFMTKTEAAEEVAKEYAEQGILIKAGSIKTIWNPNSDAYKATIREDSDFAKLVETLNNENTMFRKQRTVKSRAKAFKDKYKGEIVVDSFAREKS